MSSSCSSSAQLSCTHRAPVLPRCCYPVAPSSEDYCIFAVDDDECLSLQECCAVPPSARNLEGPLSNLTPNIRQNPSDRIQTDKTLFFSIHTFSWSRRLSAALEYGLRSSNGNFLSLHVLTKFEPPPYPPRRPRPPSVTPHWLPQPPPVNILWRVRAPNFENAPHQTIKSPVDGTLPESASYNSILLSQPLSQFTARHLTS